MPVSALKRVNEFPNSGLEVRNSKLWCSRCETEVGFKDKTTVTRHLSSNGHKGWTNAEEVSPKIDPFTINQNQQWDELAQTFVHAGIPFHSFQNQHFRDWIQKYAHNGQTMPSDSTFRRKLIPLSDTDRAETIKTCSKKDIAIILDETTDPLNRKVLNILVMPLEPKVKPRLLVSKFISECNANVIVEEVVTVVKLLKLQLRNLLVLLSDNAPYMVLAGKKLSAICERMMHTTCWAHILHLVAEELRDSMPTADHFISLMKTALLKCSSRIQAFRETMRNHEAKVRLPPTPVITRWTTWLETGSFHWVHFKIVTYWIKNSRDTGSVMNSLKALLKNNGEQLAQELERIHEVFPVVSASIKKCEKQTIPACDVWMTLKLVQDCLVSLGIPSNKIRLYLTDKHPAHQFWKDVEVLDPKKCPDKIVEGIPESLAKFSSEPVSTCELLKYKHLCNTLNLASKKDPIEFWAENSVEFPVLSPLALKALAVLPSSSDVERSFSYLKKILSPQRMTLTEDNLSIHLRLLFNGNSLNIDNDDYDDDQNT